MNQTLRDAVQRNADYGDHIDGRLWEVELEDLNKKVEACLRTTNGDAGECVVSARQLALLLKTALSADVTPQPLKEKHNESHYYNQGRW